MPKLKTFFKNYEYELASISLMIGSIIVHGYNPNLIWIAYVACAIVMGYYVIRLLIKINNLETFGFNDEVSFQQYKQDNLDNISVWLEQLNHLRSKLSTMTEEEIVEALQGRNFNVRFAVVNALAQADSYQDFCREFNSIQFRMAGLKG